MKKYYVNGFDNAMDSYGAACTLMEDDLFLEERVNAEFSPMQAAIIVQREGLDALYDEILGYTIKDIETNPWFRELHGIKEAA